MANTYTLIASSTVGSGGAANITFSSIPATYTDLIVHLSVRNDSSINGWSDLFLNVNGQGAATNISIKHLYGTGSATGSNTGGAGTSVGDTNPGGNTANSFASTSIYFSNYAGSTAKSFSSDAVTEQNASNALASLSAGLWNQTAAITSLSFTTDTGKNFVQYSTAYLYGIKNS